MLDLLGYELFELVGCCLSLFDVAIEEVLEEALRDIFLLRLFHPIGVV